MLIVEKKEKFRIFFSMHYGYNDLHWAETGKEVLEPRVWYDLDVILWNLDMSVGEDHQNLEKIRQAHPEIPIIGYHSLMGPREARQISKDYDLSGRVIFPSAGYEVDHAIDMALK